MSESSQSFVDDDLFTLTNGEWMEVKRKYRELNPDSKIIDIGLELNEFRFARQIKLDDTYVELFTIIDRKKLEYSRIKYEF